MTTPSKSFGNQAAAKPHLVRGSGGLAGEVADLRNDAEEGFQANEARTGFPELDWLDGAGPAALGSDVVLRGRNLLQGQTFDSLTLGTGTSELVFTALKPGDSGWKVKMTDTGALTVSFAAGVLTITFNGGVTTADALATAVNAEATNVGKIRCVSGGVGTTLVATTATAGDPLAGGAGDFAGNKVEVGGVEALPTHATGTGPAATWADGVITATVPDLTAEAVPLAAADVVALRVQSNGVQSDQLSDALS